MAKDGEQEGLSLESFPGTWLNTNQEVAGLAKVVIAEDSGVLRIRAFGAGGGSLEDWGEVVADTVYASGSQSRKGAAFTARQDEGAFRLEANLSKGLLIIACIPRGRDGRPGRFLREFFYRPKPGDAAPAHRPGSSGSEAALPDPRACLGRWVNTDPAARGMVEAVFRSRGPGLALHVRAADGSPRADWGEVETELLIDPSGVTEGTCIAARYDLGGTKVTLHGWIKLGVLVLASFTRFGEDSGRANVFDRDFFYRLPS